ncbi:tRNA processing endoribonuclease Trz1-like protein [Coleophoma cylindrospora]|uniref:ribonuclease Z n=1 Tax=Coleophoma cylindrospora TaxID=1849047 RepID=A0A3D8SEM8_9HELO|nr:tRNA processing endoribonuclease Trz1-like protein [Coleophoma cylindrospora]
MHQLVPKIIKSPGSRNPASTLPRILRYSPPVKNADNRQSILYQQNLRKQIRRLKNSANLPFDRVHPGPKLEFDREDYWIVFDKRRKDNVSSVPPTILPNPGFYVKMRSWASIITTPTADTPGTAILLHFDNKRYLFGNIGEGTQRACIQRKIGLRNVEDLFITGTTSWDSTGGLLGMILTLADQTSTARESIEKTRQERLAKKGIVEVAPEAKKAFLNIHGAKNLTHLLCTARRFIFRKGMPVNTNEIKPGRDGKQQDWEPTWSDLNIKVWAMAIEPEATASRSRKRSHEEMSDPDSENALSKAREEQEDEEDRNDQMRKSILSSMFNSTWRLDNLSSTKLSAVKLPAAIFVRNSAGKIEKYNGPPWDPILKNVPDVDVLVRSPWPGASIESLPPTTPSKSSISYIIKNHTQRGKFNAKEAKRLGVPPGPAFGKLSNGESVTAKDGSIVTPEMVMGTSREGAGFAVIEIPDVSYIAPTLAREEWSAPELMDGFTSIIWILAPGVLEDSRLQKFMQDHPMWKHVVSSSDCCSNYLALESAATAAIRLHLLDSERFPLPKHINDVTLSDAQKVAKFDRARPGKILLLEPNFEVNDSGIVPYLDTTKVVNEASADVAALAEIARKQVTSPEYQKKLDEQQADIPCRDAEIITLGTGSALPSKYRNVSATLLRVPGYGNYLFDCGENTLGQLKRVFGNELPSILSDLKVLWISHLHADHHLGTAAVVKAWNQATKDEPSKKLMVSSDGHMLSWLREYSEVEDFGFERLELAHLGRLNNKFEYELSETQTTSFGLTSIAATSVNHCAGALACVLRFPNGFSVAYSGDCRPSKSFEELGYGATLLIHEATFDDELKGDAMAKKHSTTSEALQVGKNMNARRIMLTHFSQRYQKIPVMNTDGDKDQIAIVAFDYMRVKLADFAKIEAYRTALLKLYENEGE